MSSSKEITRREALRRTAALLAGVVSAPTVAGVLGGCTRETGTDWSPQTLTVEQNEMVDTMAEIIIPATDTPGARAANVNRFIDDLLGESYLPEDRDRFLEGLKEANERCRKTYGSQFVDCDSKQQQALVEELDAETFGDQAENQDRESPSFFRMFKELVVVGYYTSEVGATEELKTNVVPGRYDGDIPYKEVGRAWSGAAT